MPETVTAISVVPERRVLELVEMPAPRLERDSELRARILEVGVCGTDKEICAFEYGTPPPGSDRLVIGHESLAEVTEVGAGVKGFAPGDLVVPMVRRPCPHQHCLACRQGRPDFCYTGDIRERGIKQAHGFMTEAIVDDAEYFVPVPAELRDVAVLVEPLTIAEKGLLQILAVQDRLPWACPHSADAGIGHCHRAVVLGAGPVGLLGAMALVARGFETTVYSRGPEDGARADHVRSFGARYVSSDSTDADALARAVGPIDLVYEAVGVPSVAFGLMSALGPNGVFVLTGVPALKGPSSLDADRIMRQIVLGNQVVLGSVNAGRDAFEGAIADLQTFARRWPDATRAIITGRFAPEDHRELLLGRAGGIKNVIRFARD